MRCPICKQPVSEPPAPDAPGTFPFCSERCKLIDLGRWLDGKYQIPVSDPEPDEQSDRTDSDEAQ
ncbi:MAG: DNA gyrase inhibitor YacG [Tepidisphaeraceae bacterium]